MPPNYPLNVANKQHLRERTCWQKPFHLYSLQFMSQRASESNKKLSAVVAVANNSVIGLNNALPWSLSSDLKRFRQLTMGHCLIMGRKTFDSIGKALKGRTTIVLTRQTGIQFPTDVVTASSLEHAMEIVPVGKIGFVVGGAEIYRQAKDSIDDLYVTRVLANVPGDAWLDEWDLSSFRCVEQMYTPEDGHNEWPTLFQHFRR